MCYIQSMSMNMNVSKEMAQAFLIYGDDDENAKNRKFTINETTMNDTSKLYDTPNGKHTILTSLFTNKNLNVLPTGHITAKGAKGPFARFIIKTISKNYIEATPGGINEDSLYANIKKKNNDHIIVIQNTQISEYISINNLRQISTSSKYWDKSTHWRVIVKSETLNGTKIVMLESCLNNQLLAVSDQGRITSVPTTYDYIFVLFRFISYFMYKLCCFFVLQGRWR